MASGSVMRHTSAMFERALLATVAAGGIVAARRAPLGARVAGPLAACLVIGTALGAGLIRWHFMQFATSSEVDPKLPLPEPMNSLLGTLAVLLVTAGPAMAGALAMIAVREARRGSVALAALWVVVIWYVVHWTPWVVRIALS